MKRILFLFANTHQKRLFTFMKRSFPPEYNGDLLAIKGFTFQNWLKIFSKRSPLENSTIEQIIQFSTKRMLVRHPQLRFIKRLITYIQCERAKIYYQLFYKFYQSVQPDLIILWNGLALPLAAAVCAARHLSIKVLFCENGYLPNTIVMDTNGVNARNQLAGKSRDFYDQIIIDEALLANLFNKQLQPRSLKNKFQGKQTELAVAEQQIQLPEQFVFLPLQVFDDSQILLYSPRFSDMNRLISYCVKEIHRYNLKYGQQLTLVIKEHPSDFGRSNYDKLKRKLTDTIFIRTISSQELITKSLAVITVNSTVGIEGLFCLKPVITMGEAFYNVPGLVHHLADWEELAEKLNQALLGGVDQQLVENFLYYLRYNYLISLERRQLEQADPVPVLNRIEAVLNA